MKTKLIKSYLLIILISILSFGNIFAAGKCEIDTTKIKDQDNTLSKLIQDCKPDGVLEASQSSNLVDNDWIKVSTTNNEGYKVDNAKGKILAITKKAVVLAMIFAIGGIVYAGYLFVTGFTKEDNFKKGKEAIKWSLIGFFLAIIAQQLINAIINLIYGISTN